MAKSLKDAIITGLMEYAHDVRRETAVTVAAEVFVPDDIYARLVVGAGIDAYPSGVLVNGGQFIIRPNAARSHVSASDQQHADQLRLLGRQHERAHVDEMRKVAWMAYCAGVADPDPVDRAPSDKERDFDEWWNEHVRSPDGSGIRVR